MCGIAGFVDSQGGFLDQDIVIRMTRALSHRGPDAEGFYVGPSAGGSLSSGATAALGHCRLKVIDLESGQQPLSNDDGTVWVIFNGEIYNYRSLREQMISKGRCFKTKSDTEVIVHFYEIYGPDCVRFFRGMFAFALWDVKKKRLMLARDRIGKKPIVYSCTQGKLIFASELSSVLQHPDISHDFDYEALHHYLTYQCVPSPWTAYAHVKKLPPAHYLLYENGRVSLNRYWQLDFSKKRVIDFTEAVDEMDRILEESIRLRLQSDVPLGILLSGGVDSSAVAAVASRLSPSQIKTFSIGFDEAEFNELPYARAVARQLRTDHHEAIVRPDTAALVKNLTFHYGEPFADSSALPTYCLAHMAKRYVTVVLNGDGGDETFGGYYRHLAMRLADQYTLLPEWFRRRMIEPAARFLPSRLSLKRSRINLSRFFAAASLPRPERWGNWLGLFTEPEKRAFYTPFMRDKTRDFDSLNILRDLFHPLEGLEGVDAALAADVAFYLPNDLLVKMDIATMAHGLEARSPFLDHELMEFVASVPPRMKVHGSSLKHLLKTSQKKIFSDQHVNRAKQGFAIPISHWFRGNLKEWMSEVLLSSASRIHQFIESSEIKRMAALHLSGRRDYGQHLWLFLMLELWLRKEQGVLIQEPPAVNVAEVGRDSYTSR